MKKVNNKSAEWRSILANNLSGIFFAWIIGFVIGNLLFGLGGAPFFQWGSFGIVMGIVIGLIFAAVVFVIGSRQESKIQLRSLAFWLLLIGGLFNLILSVLEINSYENLPTVILLLVAAMSIITAVQIKRSRSRQMILSSFTMVLSLLIICGVVSAESVLGTITIQEFFLIILPSAFSIIGGYLEYNYAGMQSNKIDKPKKPETFNITPKTGVRNWILSRVPLLLILAAELYFTFHLCSTSAVFGLILPIVGLLTLISLLWYRPSIVYFILALEVYLALNMLNGNGSYSINGHTYACGVGFNGIWLALIIFAYAILLYVFVIRKQKASNDARNKNAKDRKRSGHSILLLIGSVLLFIVMFFVDVIILGACSTIGLSGLPVVITGLVILFILVSRYFNNSLSGIAAILILFILWLPFSVGFCGSPLGTSCLAQSGYICQTPIAHNNILSITIGQATGTTWVTTDLVWVPQGVTAPVATGNVLPCGAPTANTMSYFGGEANNGFTCSAGSNAAGTNNAISNGQTTSAYFVFYGTAPPVGTSGAGQIWAYYQTQNGGKVYQTQVATLTLKTV